MTEPSHVFVIGASAGGVETLIRLCERLPGDLPAAVFVVLHTPPTVPGLLPSILSRHCELPALYPKNRDSITPGNIYVKDGLADNTRTPLTCPECGGGLVETHNGSMIRCECQVGHGFSDGRHRHRSKS